MKNEFTLAFNEVLIDKQLPREIIMEAIEAAMVSAYRKAVNASNAQQVLAKIDPESGHVSIYAEKEVVDSVHDERTEVSIEDALKVDPNTAVGNMVIVETTPEDFGRVAAQTARQVIQQRIREAEREEQFKYFSALVGEIVNGVVQAIGPNHITIGLDKKAEGIMPRKEQIGGERFRVHDRVRALLAEVKQTPRGPQILLSRAHRDFLRRLLEDEVPEIYHGLVEIRSIAREPGQRSKVAVAALQPGIDPVGACVGVRGVRIQAIVRELNEEKIDVIEWNADPAEYIAKALSPARVVGVFLDKTAKGAKTATVVVPEDQLSLAIGRDGQNARLAAKLTGWRIDIKSLPEAASDAVFKFQNDPAFAEMAAQEAETIAQIENILAKKAEGRPIPPEEYQALTRFVVGAERMAVEQHEAEQHAERHRLDAIRATIPKVAFETPLEDLGISYRYVILLGGEGYSTVGDLMYQLKLDSDVILALNGMGPKGLAEIEAALETYIASLPPEQTAPEPVSEAQTPSPAETQAAPEETAEMEAAEAPAAELGAADAGTLPVDQPPAEPQPEPQPAPPAAEAVSEAGEEPAPPAKTTLEEKADLDLLMLQALKEEAEEEDEDDEDAPRKDKKKKKRKKRVEIEYDPDRDVMVIRRKHKRPGSADWSEWDE